jgi:ankyrin repeat protein
VRFNPDEATPLHVAADWADTGTVATLLAMCADVNVVDCRKNPPLIRAIINGRGAQRTLAVEVVKQLLDAGADVNQKGFMNQTALHFAYKMIDRSGSQSEGTNLIELLLQKGADPTLKDASGHVPKWNMPEHGHMGMGVIPPPPQHYSSP